MSKLKALRELSSTPSSYAHMCGSFGCEAIEILPGEDGYLHSERIAWADAHKQAHGEFPDTDAQLQFIIDAKERYRTEVWPKIQGLAGMHVVRATTDDKEPTP